MCFFHIKKIAFSIKHNANVLLPHETHCKLYFFHLEATGSQRKSTSLHSISIPISIVVVQFEVTAHEHSLAIDVKSVTSTQYYTHLCTQIGKYDGEMGKEMQNQAEKQRAKWNKNAAVMMRSCTIGINRWHDHWPHGCTDSVLCITWFVPMNNVPYTLELALESKV